VGEKEKERACDGLGWERIFGLKCGEEENWAAETDFEL
jgi:hypothetical protein